MTVATLRNPADMTYERTGLHGASHSAVHRKLHSWTFLPFLQFFGGGIYAPDPSTYDPIEILLNAEGEEQDTLTARWRDNKLSELNFVGVVVCKLSVPRYVFCPSWVDQHEHLHVTKSPDKWQAALLAGVLTSTGSWSSILPSDELSPWPIRTTWYCGIVLSLFSILTAADQTVRLHRLSSHRDGLDNLRKLLSKTIRERDCEAQTRLQPSLLQVVTWQMPVMFLTSATICMIVG